MRTGGQNIKSAAEHKKLGTFKPSRHGGRLSDSDQVTPLQSIPAPPAHFDKRHAEVWTKVCEDIRNLGNLVAPDVFLIEIFVEHWFLWKDAMAEVKQNGYSMIVEGATGTRTIVNPALAVMGDSAKMCNAIADKFGFSARARMGIKITDTSKKKTASILDLIKGGTVKAKAKTG